MLLKDRKRILAGILFSSLTFLTASCQRAGAPAMELKSVENEVFLKNSLRIGLSSESYNPKLAEKNVDPSSALAPSEDHDFLQWPFGHLGDLLNRESPMSKARYAAGSESYIAIYLPKQKVDSAIDELNYDASCPEIFDERKEIIDFKYVEALGRIEYRISKGLNGHEKNEGINYFEDAHFYDCKQGDALPLHDGGFVLSGVLMKTSIAHENYFCKQISHASLDVYLACQVEVKDDRAIVPEACYEGFVSNAGYIYAKNAGFPYFAYTFAGAGSASFFMIDLDGSGGYGSSPFLPNYGRIDGQYLHCPYRLCQSEENNLSEGDLHLLSGGHYEEEIKSSVTEVYVDDQYGPLQDGSLAHVKIAKIDMSALAEKTNVFYKE